MTKCTYICDQCKAEFAENTKLTTVKLETEPYTSYPRRRKVSWYKDICNECCLKLGIKFDNPKTEKEIDTQTQSLEARLFDIFQEIAYTVQR